MSSIYYLPGRDGRLTKGLGTFLQEQCDQLAGREVSGDSLISGAIGSEATRDTSEEVEAYIKERVPAE
jgi:hypothetical protein